MYKYHMNDILILKDGYNSFERYYLNKMNTLCQCERYYKSDGLLRKLWTHFGFPFEKIWYGKWKKVIRKKKLIIIFDSLHTNHLIKYICKQNNNARIIFWHWNPIRKKRDKNIFLSTENICEHWSFNPIDIKKYGMKYNNQFFFYQDEIDNTHMQKTVFFVGADKGRLDEIQKIKKVFDVYGIKTNFNVIVKKNNKLDYCYTKPMDYEVVLHNILDSNAVLELVQEGQDGLTARALEALFYKKKLITNNVNVAKCDFYNERNIFIIGINNYKKIVEFLETDYEEIPQAILDKYSFEGWLSRFQ